MYIKFKTSFGDVSKDTLYPITRTFEDDSSVYYYFVDNVGEISAVQHLCGEKSEMFELVIT